MMKQNITAMLRYWLIGLIAISAFPALAEVSAGRFQFVSGDVRVLDSSGRERAAAKGANINEGDTIVTVGGASAQVSLVDNGFIAVRPDTRLKIETYKYNGREDGSEKGLFSLVRGGFRAITGVIGRSNKDNYQIKTPAATIGIRGTDHEPMFIPPPLPGEIAIGKPGAYDKVNIGQAYIQTPQGIANIGPNQVGYVSGLDAKPTLLPTLPDFYKATPLPGAKESKEEKKEEKKQQADSKQQKQDAKPEGKEGKEASGQKEGGKGEKTAGTAAGDKGGPAPAEKEAAGQKEGGQGAKTAGAATGGRGAPAPTTAKNGRAGAQPAGGSAVAPGMAGGAPASGSVPVAGMPGGMVPPPGNYAFNVGSDSLMGGPMPTMPGSMPGTGGVPGMTVPAVTVLPTVYAPATNTYITPLNIGGVDGSGNYYNFSANVTTSAAGTTVTIGNYTLTGSYGPALVAFDTLDSGCWGTTCNIVQGIRNRTGDIEGPLLRDTSNRLVGATEDFSSNARKIWVDPAASVGDVVLTASNNAQTGITLGRWATANMSFNNFSSSSSSSSSGASGGVNLPSPNGMHWITGNSTNAVPMTLTGTATYTVIASTPPTDQSGITGTLDTNSANTFLSLDFSKQAITSMKITAAVNNRNWVASGTDIALGGGGGGFWASTGGSTGHAISVSMDDLSGNVYYDGSGGGTGTKLAGTAGAGRTSYGSINGNLFGSTVQGAGAVYALGAYDTISPNTAAMPGFYTVTGAVAYDMTANTLTTNLATTPYGDHRIVLFSQPSLARDTAFNAPTNTPIPSYPSDVLTPVGAGLTPVGTNTAVSGNELTKFQAEYVREECSTGCNYNNYPAVITLTGAPAESGYDNASGFHWGRWSAGTMAVTDIVPATPTATVAATGNLAVANSLHYLFSDAKTTMNLPQTGSFAYSTIVGNTSPTMSDSSTGVLTSASVAADFSAMRITALNLIVTMTAGASDGMQWTASKSGEIAIQKPGYFEASTSSGNLNVTCAGAGCSSTTTTPANTGKVVGIFNSNTVSTVTTNALGISYALNNRSAPADMGKTVSGVAVLKAP